jgi:hypothetical protein
MASVIRATYLIARDTALYATVPQLFVSWPHVLCNRIKVAKIKTSETAVLRYRSDEYYVHENHGLARPCRRQQTLLVCLLLQTN